MTAKTKTVNYTPEQTAAMISEYVDQGTSVEQIAESMGKTVRSVIAKLSREKVYVAKSYVSKTGAPVVKKDTTADAIAVIANLTESETESLTKANKTALVKVLRVLQTAEAIAKVVDMA